MFAKKKKREMIRQLQETDHKIDIRMLNKSYQMGEQSLHVLKDINFTVDEGEFVAILGPSGSGKSTLMNVIGCMDQWDTGEYYLDGIPVHALNGKELTQIRNEKIGFVFQNYHLIPAYTVLQNVIMPLLMRGIDHKTAEDMCMDTIRLLGLGERLHHKPNELSGGQKQRLAIARAIAKDPKIFIFDDSFSALDLKTDAALRKALAENVKDRTVIIVAQRISTILHAEQILVLDDGKIVGKGTHEELLKSCEVYRQIAKSQLSAKELGLEESEVALNE